MATSLRSAILYIASTFAVMCDEWIPMETALFGCSLPSYIQLAVTTRPAESDQELPLVNPMCQIDSGFESFCRSAATLGLMILLKDIVNAPAAPSLH